MRTCISLVSRQWKRWGDGHFHARGTGLAKPEKLKEISYVAGRTGLEPATSGVTGRRSNQLNYRPG